MEKRNIDRTLTKDQISYLRSLGVELPSPFSAPGLEAECDLQDLPMRSPIRSSDKLTIRRGVNLLYSVYRNKWFCGYLGDEELDGYGDTPLEAVYNCFVNCVKCKVIS